MGCSSHVGKPPAIIAGTEKEIRRLLLPSFPLIVLAVGAPAQSFNLLVLEKGNRTEAIFTEQLITTCSVIAACSVNGRGENVSDMSWCSTGSKECELGGFRFKFHLSHNFSRLVVFQIGTEIKT